MKMRRILALLTVAALLLCAMPITAWAGETKQFKNVIFMIGDGMGENHLKMAKACGLELFMDNNYDLRGQSKTRSTSTVTDSAAGATALSCGVRVTNGTVGVYASDPFGLFTVPISITEKAQAKGMKTGIVTTDSTAGATPAGFSVHVNSRSDTLAISKQQVKTKFDLLWGAACSDVDTAAAESNGYQVITTKAEMDALTQSDRSFGQFSGNMWQTSVPAGDDSPTLSEMTVKAIELLDSGDNGFFLMVEGAHIDKYSHKSEKGYHYPEKVAGAVEAIEEFDNAIEAAVDFAREDGNTLVIVTADHETGAINLIDGEYTYTSGSHSGANVPLFVYCADDFIKDGEAVDNKSIPAGIAKELGWGTDEFPKAAAGSFMVILTFFENILNLLSTDVIR